MPELSILIVPSFLVLVLVFGLAYMARDTAHWLDRVAFGCGWFCVAVVDFGVFMLSGVPKLVSLLLVAVASAAGYWASEIQNATRNFPRKGSY